MRFTKTDAKNSAQDALMNAAQVAFNMIADDSSIPADEKLMVEKALEKEFCRVEKLLGFEVGSWNRGV